MSIFALLMRTLTTRNSENITTINPKAELWLLEGKASFARLGISGINIDELSKEVGIAKSSFYYLFRSKEQYLKELYQYWEYVGTRRITDTADLVEDPLVKIRVLTEMIFHNSENDQFLLQLLTFAQINADAKAILDYVNDNRQKYLFHLFQALGFNDEEAAHKTRIYMTYYFGICAQIKFQSLNKFDEDIILSDLQEILDIKFIL